MQQPSRRQTLMGAAGALATFGLAQKAVAAPHDSRAEDTLRRRAQRLAHGMSLEEKIGQLFVIEVYGRTADTAHPMNQQLYGYDTPAEVVRAYRPGGVIYFDDRRGPDNVHDPRQIAGLSNGLQQASRVPLIISVDQEGGSVVYRLTDPATMLPGNMALAATRSSRDALDSARIIGTELAAVGINQNYAPVADVNINPANPVIGVRSFGSDPGLCAEMVGAGVRGYHRGDVASAAKHFPGHGDTDTDSHYGLPVINHSRAELDRIDLPPFRAAIRRGVDTIMTAHIVVPALDSSGVPATMSHPIVTGLLREELGFDGLVVTDALDMRGASDEFPPDVAPVRALQAGCDQLVLAPQTDVARRAVLEAVRSGEITEERIDASLRRVLLHKLRRGLFGNPYVSPDRAEAVVGRPRHLARAREITDRTVTLVRNEGVLPLSTGTTRSVLVAGWGVSTTAGLADAVSSHEGQTATALHTGSRPSDAVIAEAVSAAQDSDLVVVTANAAAAYSEGGVAQAQLVEALRGTGTPVVVVAVRNPYDIQRYPDVDAYLATYSYGTPSLESVARTLFGKVSPGGRLPVAVPVLESPEQDLYPFGHGLSY
ncbi:glycoside hydrolase family 3 protein [Streptomyces sp. TR06-5]|uniref:glycoside hydrolase family 3 protein n=1 Tax=unclassified Streptomyces TaxID=2593676 RepID=UPI00399FDC5F